MGLFSRDKGKRGERELAAELNRVLGITARRGVQFQGSPDVITNLPDLHIECKRTERFQLYKALEQAVEDAGTKIPIVCHRQNNKPWVVALRLNDLPRFISLFSNTNHERTNITRDSSGGHSVQRRNTSENTNGHEDRAVVCGVDEGRRDVPAD